MNKIFQMTLNKYVAILFFLVGGYFSVEAQEKIVPIKFNPHSNQPTIPKKKKRASLPFFDDFANQSSIPNSVRWEESQVFINNTMGVGVISQGVATFDGLNEQGRPYRPNNFSAVGYGDSLTCTPIDLSFRTLNDNIVLSFWVQAQGNGFAPETSDSLFLFFKNATNDWIPVWQRQGSGQHAFLQQFVTVDNVQFLHSSFQFRFVNFTSLNLNDDVWNIDYIEMDINRSENDTTANDLAFTAQPTSILDTLTALPFKHFIPSDLSAQQEVFLRNNYDTDNTFTVRHRAEEIMGNTNISTNTIAAFNASDKSNATVTNPSYNLNLSGSGPFRIRNTYSIDRINSLDELSNDTIVTETVFDNYFAYDDGSAEKAYFLNAALNQPAKTAMKFDLRQDDTVRGLSVYFAAQVPAALGKFFSVVLYEKLGNTSSGDIVIHQQDLFKVQYPTQRGEFSSYAFDVPVGLSAGTYYIGISQPANFGSDSIYYGLDVNTNNNLQQLSYNVNGFWFNSSTPGTVMIRPMVGSTFIPTNIKKIEDEPKASFYPNPATDVLHIQTTESWNQYQIINCQGQIVHQGTFPKDKRIQLKSISSGPYFISLRNGTKHFTKQIWKR